MAHDDENTRKRARPSQKSSVPAKKQKKENHKEEASTRHVNRVPKSETGKSKSNGISSTPKTSSSTHVRFGSEELPAENVRHVAGESEVSIEEDLAEEEMDSDDEAPEDISASMAAQASKAMSASIARASKEQKLRDKRKRQEQAARANEQAALSKRKSKAENNAEESIQDPEHGIVGEEDDSEDEEAPELLPAELLAQEFIRPPTPPPNPKCPNDEIQENPRRVKVNSKAPTDRQVGPIKVRILESINNLLPPKASSKSRAVREGWLAGRRSTGPMVTERRRFKGGFVKR